MPDTPAGPTPAAAWKKAARDGELITLPGSGHVARLARPSLIGMVGTANGIPNPLSADVQRLILESSMPGAVTNAGKDEAERWASYKRNARAYVEIAALCLKEPRLILDGEPPADCIGPGDLVDYDYIWIYHVWVEGLADVLLPFRVDLGPDPDRRDRATLRQPAQSDPQP